MSAENLPAAMERWAPEVLEPEDESTASDDDSVDSDRSEMEPFEEYKTKIMEVLATINMANFDVEPLHHGYTFQNNVYVLTSPNNPNEQYIMRVPVLPDFRECDGVCESIENDAALLNYIHDKLPVPKVMTFCATKDNALNAPFTLQTKIPGQRLDDVYEDLSQDEKLDLIDQIVDLMAKLEAIQFPKAGKFAVPSHTSTPSINIFSEGDPDFTSQPSTTRDRQGSDLKACLISHTNGWIVSDLKEEANGEHPLTLIFYKELLRIMDSLSEEGAFAASHPIVLHHWDFEPRNILVEKTLDAKWRISGIIDWDDAIAVPRPLARRPLDWIWDFDGQEMTGYLNTDHQPRQLSELSGEDRHLKERFDALAAERLEGYIEDAYGYGRWLRRIWTFARGSAKSCWYLDLVQLLFKDWEARPKPVVEKPWTFWGLFARVGELLDPRLMMR